MSKENKADLRSVFAVAFLLAIIGLVSAIVLITALYESQNKLKSELSDLELENYCLRYQIDREAELESLRVQFNDLFGQHEQLKAEVATLQQALWHCENSGEGDLPNIDDTIIRE